MTHRVCWLKQTKRRLERVRTKQQHPMHKHESTGTIAAQRKPPARANVQKAAMVSVVFVLDRFQLSAASLSGAIAMPEPCNTTTVAA